MPTPIPPGLRLGLLEPHDAAEAFARRGLLEPSFRWEDVWQEEHARAFAVAGVMRMDVLAVFRREVEAALTEGRSLAEFRRALRPQLAQAGFWGDVTITDPDTGEQRITRFDDRRLRTIYDVNLRQSHAAGKWARIERNKQRFPFVLYETQRDERVRASHRPWDGVVLPVDHPWWNTHFPPNGWACRCHASAIDERGIGRLKAAGVPIQREAPAVQWMTYVNARTGEVAPVPRGVDPGFAYNPGKARDAALYEQALRKSVATHPIAAARVVAQARLDHPKMVAQLQTEFSEWFRQADWSAPRGEVKFVGTLHPWAVRALRERDIDVASAAIAVSDADVAHALRGVKVAAGKALAAWHYERLPTLLADASAMLLQETPSQAILYVTRSIDPADGRTVSLVVMLDYETRVRIDGKRTVVPLNRVRTVQLMDPQALEDRTRYQLVWGTLPT